MFNLLRAEWQKVTGNRLLTSFTVWVFPVGIAAFVAVMTVLVLVTERPPVGVGNEWTTGMIGTWGALTRFPGSIFIRMFVTAFMAAFFAGEYEWGTWKNIVPRNRRWKLMFVKFWIFALMVILSLFLTSIIVGAGRWLPFAVGGFDYGPAVTRDVMLEFLPEYGVEAALAFATALLLAGLAALAVLLTRSVVGGLLLGFGLSIIEAVSGFILLWIATLFDAPQISNGYAYTPTYSIENIRAWALNGAAVQPPYLPLFDAQLSLISSILILAAWIFGLMLLAALIFQRQDLTN